MTKIKDLEIAVFAWLVTAGEVEFLTSNQAEQLDTEYRFGHSGNKGISVYLENLLSVYPEQVALEKAYKSVAVHFKDKWKRLYDAYVTKQYDPIENYSSTEEEHYQTKVENETETNGDAYGFGSDDASPLSKSTMKSTTSSDPENNTRTLTRRGNIGVTTSQQMLQSEIDLRKWDYYDNLFRDIDSVLALDIYI